MGKSVTNRVSGESDPSCRGLGNLGGGDDALNALMLLPVGSGLHQASGFMGWMDV